MNGQPAVLLSLSLNDLSDPRLQQLNVLPASQTICPVDGRLRIRRRGLLLVVQAKPSRPTGVTNSSLMSPLNLVAHTWRTTIYTSPINSS